MSDLPFGLGLLAGACLMYLGLLVHAEWREQKLAAAERRRMSAARRNCRPRVIRDVDTGHHRVVLAADDCPPHGIVRPALHLVDDEQ